MPVARASFASLGSPGRGAFARLLHPVFLADVLFSAAFAVNIILIPLYVKEAGYSPLTIAAIVAVPALFAVSTSMLGGVTTDKFGERRVLLLCFTSATLSGLVLWSGVGLGLIALMVAQLLMGFSRSVFWTASISYVSRMHGQQQASRLSAFNALQNLGMLAGFTLAGAVVGAYGFEAGFLLFTLLAALAAGAGLAVPPLPRAEGAARGPRQLWRQVRAVASRRAMHFAALAALFGALPLALVGSFYPIWMVELGFDKPTIGLVTTSQNVAVVLASLCLAFVARRSVPLTVLGAATVFVGGFLYLFQAASSPLAVAGAIAGAAAAAAVLTLLYQSLVGVYCADTERGTGAAFTNEFWALGLVVTPVVFGSLTQAYSLDFAFRAVGLSVVLLGCLLWYATSRSVRPLSPRQESSV